MRLRATIVALICLTIVLHVVLLAYPISSTTSHDVFKRTVSILVPAVSQTEEGLKGVISNITVTIVKPGSGKVYISATPLTEIDMQASARTAAIIASTVLGENPLTMDYYVSVESPSIIIGGPSAGAALTLAIMSAISGYPVNGSVMITGMINPDGTIGPVGGVKEKLEAAASVGMKIFLVPVGQSVVQENIVERRRIGPFIIRTVKPVEIDLVEYGRKLGVTVIEVSNIIEAAKYLLNMEIAEKPLEDIELKLSDQAKSLLTKQITEFKNAYENIKSRIKEASGVIADVLREADARYRSALKLSGEGKLYSATSMLFQAVYLVDFAYRLQEYYERGEGVIQEFLSEVNSTINSISSKVYAVKPTKLSDVEVLIASRYRIYLAKKSLEQAAEMYSQGKYEDTIFSLVYAKWRAKTAELWIQALGLGGREAPSEVVIQHISALFLYEANSVVAYASSLLKDIGVVSDELFNKAVKDLEEAEEMSNMGDYYGSLGLSLSAIAEATTSIHKYFTVNIEKQLESVRSVAEKSLKHALSLDTEPLLALGYYEFAQEQENMFDKIYFYELSSLHAKVLGIVDTIESPGNVSIRTASPTIPSSPGKTPAPLKEQELSNIIVKVLPILASFIGGILVGYSLKRGKTIA